jgi:iron complex outermembrane receptor protein
MHKCIGLILALLVNSNAIAQFTISGTVRELKTGQPLGGTNIALRGTSIGTVSDSDGKYHLDKLSPGTFTIWVTYIGYADTLRQIELNGDLEIDFFLKEDRELLVQPVIIHGTRAGESTPTTYTNVSSKTLQAQNFGQDLPFLLNWTPSVVTTSDAGTGVGYTGIRIRGSDATRVNVTINGIPYNDSESQSTYWVDIPDITSSSQSIQIQRGVGTSTNGAGAFGASVNLETKGDHEPHIPYGEMIAAYGSFGTQRYTVRAGSGFLGNSGWYVDGKFSKISSDGYVDRAKSDLTSYYGRIGFNNYVVDAQLIAFGGKEKTYQSWYGIDSATLQTNRRMNYAGALYDASGNVTGYYGNQVDDYKQDHLQLHFSIVLSPKWSAKVALHNTFGRGFYEEYHQDRTFSSVGLPDYSTLTSTDMVVRKWLDNRFYGVTYQLQYVGNKSSLLLGGAASQYSPAHHFGEIIWAKEPGSVPQNYNYYNGSSDKGDRNIYLKWNYKISGKLSSFVDVQYRGIDYQTMGTQDDQSSYAVGDHFDFFNPKAGLSYSITGDGWESNTLYASYAIANREPGRSDYLEGATKPRPERLYNLEIGWRMKEKNHAVDVNYFLMTYSDQLVQTGAIDNGGYPIRANVGRSYRTGFELSGATAIGKKVNWNANLTWSVNQNKDFVVFENSLPVAKSTNIILSPGVIAGSQLSWKPFTGLEAAWLSKYVGSQYLDNTESARMKLSDYWINDLRFSYELHPKGFKSIGWSLLLNNVLDVMYSSNGYGYGGTPYYFPQAGRNLMGMMTVKF